MTALRHFLRKHCTFAAWLIFAALLMKVVVPVGYMPVMTGSSITIELCSGFGPEKMMAAMPGMGDHHGSQDHSGKGDMPCGFGGHAPPALSTVDPVLLLLAIAFVMTLGFLVVRRRLPEPAVRLRPPPIGPPLIL
uniref:DUF2946 family protein n=1 Tax=uncultured Sphingomonas sp. TaxID=158754 RepID=UPI0035CC1869